MIVDISELKINVKSNYVLEENNQAKSYSITWKYCYPTFNNCQSHSGQELTFETGVTYNDQSVFTYYFNI